MFLSVPVQYKAYRGFVVDNSSIIRAGQIMNEPIRYYRRYPGRCADLKGQGASY